MAREHHNPQGIPTTQDVIDPVCGMTVSPATAADSFEYHGTVYHFCSRSCFEKFKAEPERYLHTGDSNTTVDELGEYTCPMHPEVRQHGPAPCPKCGMALEPAAPPIPQPKVEHSCPMQPESGRSHPGDCPICGMALEPREVVSEAVNPELLDMRRRFCVSVRLTAPSLALMISEMIPGKPIQTLLGPAALLWCQFVLASPVVLWGGWPFFVRGWQSILNRHLN